MIYLRIAYCMLVCCFAGAQSAYAQSVTLSVAPQTSLSWSIDTESEIENNQSKVNALQIKIKNRSGGAKSVYVRCSQLVTPPGFATSDVPLILDFKSENSSHTISNLITTPFQVTLTDQRMFTHPQHANNATYTFVYDLVLKATNWEFPPGTYDFTLLFTFVSP